jgi:hypothetical protein
MVILKNGIKFVTHRLFFQEGHLKKRDIWNKFGTFYKKTGLSRGKRDEWEPYSTPISVSLVSVWTIQSRYFLISSDESCILTVACY